jgi:hypothetical protein
VFDVRILGIALPAQAGDLLVQDGDPFVQQVDDRLRLGLVALSWQ